MQFLRALRAMCPRRPAASWRGAGQGGARCGVLCAGRWRSWGAVQLAPRMARINWALFIFDRPSTSSCRARLYSSSRVRSDSERWGLPVPCVVRFGVSWRSRRCLFTVRAAISLARLAETPRRRWLSLMCSYCRSRLLLHREAGIAARRGGWLAPARLLFVGFSNNMRACG